MKAAGTRRGIPANQVYAATYPVNAYLTLILLSGYLNKVNTAGFFFPAIFAFFPSILHLMKIQQARNNAVLIAHHANNIPKFSPNVSFVPNNKVQLAFTT